MPQPGAGVRAATDSAKIYPSAVRPTLDGYVNYQTNPKVLELRVSVVRLHHYLDVCSR